MELDRVEKPLRELRKLLKTLPQNPPPEDVHKLRTNTRRVEAIASAIELSAQKETRRLLKVLKPVRRAAGSVRDIDVLTADLLHLQQDSNSESIARLIEYLAAQRNHNAGQLLDTIVEHRKPARRRLKNYEQVVESVASRKRPVRSERTGTSGSLDSASSAADILIAELTRLPALNSSNLHDFRLKVKELFYLLQTFSHSDPRFVTALGNAKNAIGEWHDWVQLAEIARETLDPDQDRDLIAQIEDAGKQKLTRALTISNSLRRRYFQSGKRPSKAS